MVRWVMAEHFTHFTANYCLKTKQEQQEDNSTYDICYLEYILRPEQPLSLNFLYKPGSD